MAGSTSASRGCPVVTLLVFVAAWCVLTRVHAAEGDAASFQGVVSYHLERYPELEIEDLYKLAFQAAMGGEHAVPSRDGARQWLERELSSLSQATNEPCSELLSPDGELVRVNLRPYFELGGDKEALLVAFVETAGRFESSEKRLEEYWRTLETMAAADEIPFAIEELRAFWSEMVSQGLPAVHHSPDYRDLYEPAYRVVLIELLRTETGTFECTSPWETPCRD